LQGYICAAKLYLKQHKARQAIRVLEVALDRVDDEQKVKRTGFFLVGSS
jgi:hypothetical protein